MSRLHWAVLLAAIFWLLSWLGESNPSGFATSPTLGVSEKRTASQFLWRSAGTEYSTLGNFPPNVGGTGATQSQPKGLLTPIHAAASGTATIRLSDLPVGKVIQVGQIKFVKVGADQYLAINLCPDGSTYSSYFKGCVIKTTTYSYTGNYQTFTAPATGTYVVELWGANGYDSGIVNTTMGCVSYGAYTKGQIQLSKSSVLHFYLGQQGNLNTGGYNGGGSGRDKQRSGNNNTGYKYGGGASDVRINLNANWNNTDSLRSRIMTAAGSGGCASLVTQTRFTFGHGGGLTGGSFTDTGYPEVLGGGANQVDGGKTANHSCASGTSYAGTAGSFGQGGTGGGCSDSGGSVGGGGGWYGGGGGPGLCTGSWSGGGGSSYISGHTGCVAVTSTSSSTPKSGCTTGTTNNSCSITPYINPATGSGYTFTNTVMIDGAGYAWTNVKGSLQQMPSPASVGTHYASGVGHTGNGAARITQLSVYLGI